MALYCALAEAAVRIRTTDQFELTRHKMQHSSRCQTQSQRCKARKTRGCSRGRPDKRWVFRRNLS